VLKEIVDFKSDFNKSPNYVDKKDQQLNKMSSKNKFKKSLVNVTSNPSYPANSALNKKTNVHFTFVDPTIVILDND
jgi:hypothetical protein